MHQHLWGYKVEEKIYLWLREGKRLNITALEQAMKAQWRRRSIFLLFR